MGLVDSRAVDRLTSAVEKDIASDLYHGVVMEIYVGGRSVYSAAIGQSDKRRARPARTDDIFLGMSISKAFASVLVLQAIDRGDLQLDTRVAEVIPSFAAKGKQRVTVRHLLTHTGGTFAGFQVPPPLDWARDAGNITKCVEIISVLQGTHAPGSRVVYNPWAGHAVLAEVARRLDGKDRRFKDIVKEEIFDPLGMTTSSYGLAVDAPRRVPVAVAEPDTAPQERAVMEALNQIIDADCEIPAGGAFTTCADAMRFVEMLRNGGSLEGVRILSSSLTAYALRNHTGTMPNDFWDYSKEQRGIDQFPARFCLLGGYVRDEGHYLSPMGLTASPRSYAAVGGGSTMIMFDPVRELSLVFLSAGFLEGLNHFRRLQKVADLALAVVN